MCTKKNTLCSFPSSCVKPQVLKALVLIGAGIILQRNSCRLGMMTRQLFGASMLFALVAQCASLTSIGIVGDQVRTRSLA